MCTCVVYKSRTGPPACHVYVGWKYPTIQKCGASGSLSACDSQASSFYLVRSEHFLLSVFPPAGELDGRVVLSVLQYRKPFRSTVQRVPSVLQIVRRGRGKGSRTRDPGSSSHVICNFGPKNLQGRNVSRIHFQWDHPRNQSLNDATGRCLYRYRTFGAGTHRHGRRDCRRGRESRRTSQSCWPDAVHSNPTTDKLTEAGFVSGPHDVWVTYSPVRTEDAVSTRCAFGVLLLCACVYAVPRLYACLWLFLVESGGVPTG